jgi:RNA polymerase sigma-70 factor (ECF subfamily)
MELDDDREMVRRMLAGDQRAFDAFFNGYSDRVFRFALTRLGGDVDAAEDAAQQTLCRAVEKLGQFRGEASLFTWLCQICRNAIADSFRAKGAPRGFVVPFDDNEEIRAALEAISSMSTHDPLESASNAQLTSIVRAVLDYLPRRYGDVLEWKYMQGCSVAEIADRLSVGHKAAESMLVRARTAFRDGIMAIASAEVIQASLGGHS